MALRELKIGINESDKELFDKIASNLHAIKTLHEENNKLLKESIQHSMKIRNKNLMEDLFQKQVVRQADNTANELFSQLEKVIAENKDAIRESLGLSPKE